MFAAPPARSKNFSRTLFLKSIVPLHLERCALRSGVEERTHARRSFSFEPAFALLIWDLFASARKRSFQHRFRRPRVDVAFSEFRRCFVGSFFSDSVALNSFAQSDMPSWWPRRPACTEPFHNVPLLARQRLGQRQAAPLAHAPRSVLRLPRVFHRSQRTSCLERACR